MLCFEHLKAVVRVQNGHVVVFFIVVIMFVMLFMLFIPGLKEFVPGKMAIVVRVERF